MKPNTLQATPTPPCTIGLIIIGDEILSGKRADKHLPKTIELLKARGLALDYADYVGDSPERITATLRRAFASGDLVFPAVALVLRRMTTPANAPPVRLTLTWFCTPRLRS